MLLLLRCPGTPPGQDLADLYLGSYTMSSQNPVKKRWHSTTLYLYVILAFAHQGMIQCQPGTLNQARGRITCPDLLKEMQCVRFGHYRVGQCLFVPLFGQNHWDQTEGLRESYHDNQWVGGTCILLVVDLDLDEKVLDEKVISVLLCLKLTKTLQEKELSSALTQTVPRECNCQNLTFEWSNLWILDF